MQAIGFDQNPPESVAQLLGLCRFCLKRYSQMKTISPPKPSASDIPEMFALLTGVELDISPEYPILVCALCETMFRQANQFRSDLMRVADDWKRLLAGIRWKDEEGFNTSHFEHFDVKTETLNDVEQKYGNDSDDSEDNIALGQLKLETRKCQTENDHQPEAILICDICGDQVTSRHLLLRHMSAKHGSKSSSNRFTCHICGKTNLKRITHHMRDHRKEDKFQCAHCPKSFNRHCMMLQHERQHTGERPFICEMCAFSFTSISALRRHCKMHTLPDGGQTKNYQKVQRTNRLRVVQTAPIPKLPPHQGVRLECPICRNTYVNRVSIQRHMKLQHGVEGMVAWKQMLDTTCLVCNEKFVSHEALVGHRPVHIEHQCPICRRRFHSKITLDLHTEKHSKKARPFKCHECDASYPCSFTLKIHFRRAHTDERPFACNECGRRFVELSVLNAHIRKVHSIEGQLKTHRCQLCPESFKTKDALRSHTEKHTGQYRYMCRLCQRNMHSGPQLAEHNRIYHPEKLSAAGMAAKPVEGDS